MLLRSHPQKSISQAESHARSENIKFGIRHRVRSGKAILNHAQFLGYTKGKDGVLRVVPEEAEIVHKIFDLYVHGNGVRKIKRYLEEHSIKTVTEKAEWSTSTIYSRFPDWEEKNKGQLALYLVEDAHEAIIDRETFEKVQKTKGRIGTKSTN